MPNSMDNQVNQLKFSGFFRARVVKNDDPMKEGRLGLFIPSLITELPEAAEEPAPKMNTVKTDIFKNNNELSLPSQIKSDNYIWARPSQGFVEKGGGGLFRIPTVGTMVLGYFEGDDSNKLYWLPFTPTVKGDVIPGKHLGKGQNVEETASNWTDVKKKVEVNVIAEHVNGNIVYIDKNENVNAFVIRWANGHTLSITHAKESGIILETEKGHVIQLDENSKQIRIHTHTSQVKAVLDDNGDITVDNSKDTAVTTKGNVTIKCSAITSIISKGPMFVKAPTVAFSRYG
jgi:phage anti-repressor protein